MHTPWLGITNIQLESSNLALVIFQKLAHGIPANGMAMVLQFVVSNQTKIIVNRGIFIVGPREKK